MKENEISYSEKAYRRDSIILILLALFAAGTMGIACALAWIELNTISNMGTVGF